MLSLSVGSVRRAALAGGIALVALGALAPAPVAAQEEGESEARMHFRLGRAYYDSGRFDEAANEFQMAYDQSRRPALLYNLFVAHRDAGNLAEATEALRAYLREEPEIENRDQLTARLGNMEEMLARQTEGGDGEGSGDGDSGGAGDGGEAGGSGDGPGPEPQTDSGATGDAAPAPSGGGGGGGLWVPGFIIAGVGGAAIVVGAILGGVALGAQSSLEADYDCDADGFCDPGFEDAASSGAALAGAADGLLWGGVAIAATGVILALVLADDGDGDVAAGAACGPDGCVAQLGGSF